MTDRDYKVLEHILNYCREIQDTLRRFGPSLESLLGDLDYKKSITLSLLQIGELSTQLSDEFRKTYNDIPWSDIRGIRNVIAHHYGALDDKVIFETATVDVPSLAQYAERLLAEHISGEENHGRI